MSASESRASPVQFASDNNSAICPEAWDALERANAGHAPAYGADDWTAAARDAIAALFETACDVFFVYTGTAANSLALAAMCRSAGLAVADMIGMTYNPIARRYALTPDTSVNYILHAHSMTGR